MDLPTLSMISTPTTSKHRIFIDTSSFVALQNKKDPSHNQAIKISKLLLKKKFELYTSSDIVGETITVLSKKLSKKEAHLFYEEYHKSDIKEIHINESIHQETRKFFLKLKSKNISFIDCSSVVAMKSKGIKNIFSFDQDFKKLGILMISASST